MSSVVLSETTYALLQRKAQEASLTPDQVADSLLREQLAPQHAYIEIVPKSAGPTAVVRGTRVSVGQIVGYLRLGETPESVVETLLPSLTLAQVYDALSYYHDHQDEIEQELAENTEEYGQRYLREQLGDDGYLRITGRGKTDERGADSYNLLRVHRLFLRASAGCSRDAGAYSRLKSALQGKATRWVSALSPRARPGAPSPAPPRR